MPSLAQLQAEPYWGREVVSVELDRLGDRLCSHFDRPASAWGDKGNEVHLRGAHRSQEWILNSAFCTSRTYTVQSGLSDWQRRLIAGGDFTPAGWGTSANRALMVQITGRLITAAKADRLPGVIEIGGTLDGRNPTGWHVIQRRVLNFDSSHLDHVHLTFDRSAVESRAVMDNVFNIMIGDDMSWSEVLDYPGTPQTNPLGYPAGQILIGTNQAAFNAWAEAKTGRAEIRAELTALRGVVEQLAEAIRNGGGTVDTAAILAGVDTRLAAQRTAIEAELRDAVADLGEGGAAQVRADA